MSTGSMCQQVWKAAAEHVLAAEISRLWQSGHEQSCARTTQSWSAGHFGFQRDMHAISSLWEAGSEDSCNVRALLDSTLEVVQRAKIYARWWRLWRADVRAGWVAFGRYKVRGSGWRSSRQNLCRALKQPRCCKEAQLSTHASQHH